MRVLVTGSEGYIGSELVKMLANNGHDVVGLDSGFYREGMLYAAPENRPPTINKDTRGITEEDLRGFDAVVHLAELSNDPLGETNEELTRKINYLASVELAKKAKAAGVSRFVYSSSCSVYGAASDEFVTEESKTNPQTMYAKCKLLVEDAVSKLADDNFSPTFLRNATAYGPSSSMRFDLVLNNLAGLAWTTGEIKMTSDGTPHRPLVHVLDICQAILRVLEAPKGIIHNQIFNVGSSGANYQIKEIAQIVAKVFPGCRVTFGKSDGDTRSYRVSFEKINKNLPGFKCVFGPKDGAEQLREVFERVGLDRATFESRLFTRLKQIKYLLETKQIDDNFFWSYEADH